MLHTVATTADTRVRTHLASVAIEPVTGPVRQAAARQLPARAEFAVIAYTAAGGPAVLITDAEVVNILATARGIAAELGATFIEPDAVCDYCARPVPAGIRFCPPRPHRDCSGFARGSEATYRRRVAA